MPIRYDGDAARFDGACDADAAQELLEWLEPRPGRAAIDLAGCTGLHTAVLQVLLAARPAVAAVPEDPFLRRWVTPLLEA